MATVYKDVRGRERKGWYSHVCFGFSENIRPVRLIEQEVKVLIEGRSKNELNV